MQSLTHRNIVRYWGTQRVRDEFHIFMEYVSGGSIATLLEKYGSFNEHLIRTYTRQILQGLLYLHSHRIMHRDIKGSNILVVSARVRQSGRACLGCRFHAAAAAAGVHSRVRCTCRMVKA